FCCMLCARPAGGQGRSDGGLEMGMRTGCQLTVLSWQQEVPTDGPATDNCELRTDNWELETS
ncbi:MAG: hypothetical protein ABFE01_04935, partial [Phycisphaerales bacterium]